MIGAESTVMTANIQTISEIHSIRLSRGMYAIIECGDLEKVSQYKYCAARRTNTWYAVRFVAGCTILMHQDIMGVKKGFDIDHINGNGLDNRRSNLRHCTRRQNLQNSRKQNSKRYKGTRLHKGKYQARITINGKQTALGSFDTEIEAAQAYDLAAIEHFGTFANINEYSQKDLENGQI